MTTIGQSHTYDPILQRLKNTTFFGHTDLKEKTGFWSRRTEHQTHGIRFELLTKEDGQGGTKKYIQVTIFEECETACYPARHEKSFDLIDLVHFTLGVEPDSEKKS